MRNTAKRFKHFTARLIGGPCDGKVMPVVGPFASIAVRLRNGKPARAMYRWDQLITGEFIGEFAGLRGADGSPCRKDGSKLPSGTPKRKDESDA